MTKVLSSEVTGFLMGFSYLLTVEATLVRLGIGASAFAALGRSTLV